MTDEDFIGYLLDLVDPDERVAVEGYLAANPDAVVRVDRLRAALSPLEADRDDPAPLPGLATRTVARLAAALVQGRPQAGVPPEEPSSQAHDNGRPGGRPPREVFVSDRPEPRVLGGRFRADLVVAAGIGLVAVGLVLSFVSRARYQSDLLACQNNLRVLHQGLAGYADAHAGQFPRVGGDPYPTAGSFILALTDAGQCPPAFHPNCPASSPATFEVSTTAATPPQVAQVTYTYSLGHLAPGGVVLGLQRSESPSEENDLLPVIADFPAASASSGDRPTSPHRVGHNVLYMGGNVRYATTPTVGVNGDDIYRNQLGRVAAGLDRSDAVLGLPGDRP